VRLEAGRKPSDWLPGWPACSAKPSRSGSYRCEGKELEIILFVEPCALEQLRRQPGAGAATHMCQPAPAVLGKLKLVLANEIFTPCTITAALEVVAKGSMGKIVIGMSKWSN